MINRWMLPFAITAMLAAGGCSRASVKTPVAGTIPDLDEGAIQALNGRWAGDNYVMATRVKDAAKGIVEVVFLIQETEEIRVERTEAQIRETPAGMVASYKEDGKSDYTFVRFAPGENWIAIFTPDVDAIRGAVRAGSLNGNVARDKDGKEGDDVTLDRLGPEEFARSAALFHRDPAVILMRVSKGEK